MFVEYMYASLFAKKTAENHLFYRRSVSLASAANEAHAFFAEAFDDLFDTNMLSIETHTIIQLKSGMM